MDNTQPTVTNAPRARVLWHSKIYNDEVVLAEVLHNYPSAGWAVISERFNEAVPPSRRRTLDAITSKGKVLQRKARTETSTRQQSSSQPDVLDVCSALGSTVISHRCQCFVTMIMFLIMM